MHGPHVLTGYSQSVSQNLSNNCIKKHATKTSVNLHTHTHTYIYIIIAMSTTISISPHSGGSVALDCKHLFGGREMDGLGDACIIVVCGCVTGLETNKK